MKLTVENELFEAGEIKTPNVSILVVSGAKGMLACGYINCAAGDKFGDAVAIVRGVKTYDDMLKAVVQEVNQTAVGLGAAAGMTGQQVLKLFGGVQ